ncbi:hypothetical protein OG394_33285 [Kribbella sp. NBC_01245]|uniref:hypothetical protein n=1 Tax=Kribbella sp. NBC_01245 TaxID=2903578 RepID=UPI002E2E5790|nr:hypothetical protein [Kribbella sp. NBC_01245]
MQHTSEFALRVDFPAQAPTGHPPSGPRLTVLVDGVDVIGAATGQVGWSPDVVLSDDSPFLPSRPGDRIAIYHCACPADGCGVVAPMMRKIVGQLWWMDFRSYTGVFDGPRAIAEIPPDAGERLQVPTLIFDDEQYRAEVARAIAAWRDTAQQLSA